MRGSRPFLYARDVEPAMPSALAMQIWQAFLSVFVSFVSEVMQSNGTTNAIEV